MKDIHLKYKMETGIDAPDIESELGHSVRYDNIIEYVEWLEEEIENGTT